MSTPMTFDIENLEKLFAAMASTQRRKALKRAFRREANRVRKTAVGFLRGALKSNSDLEKGIRTVVWKRKAGFRVTIGTKQKSKKSRKEYGFHTNRRGLKKPVLIWAECGTAQREVKSVFKKGFRFSSDGKWRTTYRNRGVMKHYGFMSDTLSAERLTVTSNMREEIIKSVKQEAEKYGCK